jgi:hypothetical protein
MNMARKMDSIAHLVVGVALSLTAATGCSSGWACGLSAGREGCYCTSGEVSTTSTMECNASALGAPHCCDDPAEDTCACRPPPQCWMDGDACLCGLYPPAGTTPVDSCTAGPGLVCCRNDIVSVCSCGLMDCPLSGDQLVPRCGTSDVEVCRSNETPVSDCVTRE